MAIVLSMGDSMTTYFIGIAFMITFIDFFKITKISKMTKLNSEYFPDFRHIIEMDNGKTILLHFLLSKMLGLFDITRRFRSDVVTDRVPLEQTFLM